MWSGNGSFLYKALETDFLLYYPATPSSDPYLSACTQQLLTTPRTHINIVWTRCKFLISSTFFRQFLHSKTHHFYHSQALRSAGISGGSSALPLCGSSQFNVLPRFKELVKWMLCYAPQITSKNEELIPVAAGVVAGKWPLVLSLLRNFLVKCSAQSCASSRCSLHSVTSHCAGVKGWPFNLSQLWRSIYLNSFL